MAKILMTGNPEYGICKAVNDRLKVTCISRSSGIDLTQGKNWDKVAEMSLEYDVFINNSALWRMHQSLLLHKVYERWLEEKKEGLIICLGSTADIGIRGGSRMYPVEKVALKQLCRQLSLNALAGTGIRVTLLSPGYVDTGKTQEKHPSKNKINKDYIAELIDWLIQQPKHLMINELSLDPIQDGDYSRERRIHDPKKQTQ